MTQEKIRLLDSIGFRWAAPRGQTVWNKRFRELSAFKEKVGHFGHANYHLHFLRTNVRHPYFLFISNCPSQEGHCNFPTQSKVNPGVF